MSPPVPLLFLISSLLIFIPLTRAQNLTRFTAPDGVAGDGFGSALAISGPLVVVGAPLADFNFLGMNLGAAYVYNCTSSTSCTLLEKLAAPNGAAEDRFGCSVGMSGHLLAVGACGRDLDGKDRGAVYIFDCSFFPCTWADTLFSASETQLNFGRVLDVSGHLVAVSAVGSSAHLFDCSSLPCVRVAQLVPQASDLSPDYGTSIAISGTRVVVGNPRYPNPGLVHLFDCSTLPCSQQLVLDESRDREYGSSVDIDGSIVAIGEGNARGFEGSFYLFDCSSSPCILVGKNYATVEDDRDQFGKSISLDPPFVLVGAPGNSVVASQQGSVYLYDCTFQPCVTIKKFVTENPQNLDYFGDGAIGLQGTFVAMGLRRYGKESFYVADGSSAFCNCSAVGAFNALCNSTGFCPCKTGFIGMKCTEEILCPAQGSYQNANWPATRMGTTGVGTCLSGLAGSPKRNCLNVNNNGVWQANVASPCEDANECALGIHNCSSSAICTDTPGSFSCICRSGYSGDGFTCSQIDECTSAAHTCHDNATCIDTPGSFTCECLPGFSGSGFVCGDVDECAEGTDDCSSAAVCSNTFGGFSCACNPGYSGDGVICTNVNECASDLDDCHENAACQDSAGSFTCQCNPGYSGSGTDCEDIDECTKGTHTCSPSATCSNTIGSFSCACNSGFSGNGNTCINNNECMAGTGDCDSNAICADTPGSFTCSCRSGYEGDGKNCSNLNECALSVAVCDEHATCQDTVGSFTCTCLSGYYLVGFACFPLVPSGCENPEALVTEANRELSAFCPSSCTPECKGSLNRLSLLDCFPSSLESSPHLDLTYGAAKELCCQETGEFCLDAGKGGMTGGAKAGIAVGVSVAVVIVAAAAVFVFLKKGKGSQAFEMRGGKV